MRRSKWMLFIIIASLFIAVPGFGLELKIATLSPEGSVWMDRMQTGAAEIHRKTETIMLKPLVSQIHNFSELFPMSFGFGRFCVKEKARRRGRNPATVKDLILAPRKVVRLKWSGKLKEKLNTKP